MTTNTNSSRFKRLVIAIGLCAFLVPLLVGWQARSSSPSVPTACQTGDANVTIADFMFTPSAITIVAGRAVCWTNNGPSFHTSTSDTAVWDSLPLGPGQTFRFTFTSGGTYHYHCNFHSF